MKVVLIGGHPKGYDRPFHNKTKSGRVLEKIFKKLKFYPELFNLWSNQEEEDSRILSKLTKERLNDFINKKYKLVTLGRYIEKCLRDNNFNSDYLPHPASRDIKYIKKLETGLLKLK
jgi:hypothetical protein